MILHTKRRKDGVVSKGKKEESRYIRMVRAIFKVCKRQCIPLLEQVLEEGRISPSGPSGWG